MSGFGAEGGLFRRLRDAAAGPWVDYIWHPFVQALSRGTLPLPAFRHYLVQDYLFLIHFARAEALAVVKAESLEAMQEKVEAVRAILGETALHLRFCAEWGLDPAAVRATAEAPATVAYTRWVMDRGLAGDILDLEVALAPCTIGYGEVAQRILADPARRHAGNPYEPWIAAYASPAYQALAAAAASRLDALGETHGGAARFAALAAAFREGARLEAAFWQQGLDAAR
ncbi:MAG TPA: TenA family protein [Crenalkalicoccus sp.]|nr:TenA family protein [Crenalkalicoccus sp.]